QWRRLSEANRRGRRRAADNADGVRVPDENHVGRLAGEGGCVDGHPRNDEDDGREAAQEPTNRGVSRSRHWRPPVPLFPPDSASDLRRVVPRHRKGGGERANSSKIDFGTPRRAVRYGNRTDSKTCFASGEMLGVRDVWLLADAMRTPTTPTWQIA